jgi:hypothetical protein
MPFNYSTDTIRTHGNTDFHQLAMQVSDSTGFDYMVMLESKFQFKATGNSNFNLPFDAPVVCIDG